MDWPGSDTKCLSVFSKLGSVGHVFLDSVTQSQLKEVTSEWSALCEEPRPYIAMPRT